MSEFVRFEVQDGVGTIHLDRPPMNALSAQVQQDIRGAAFEATQRADVRAVVDKANAVSPDLVAALQAFSDRALAERMAESMAPLAILGGESVSEVLARLLQGTAVAKALPGKK